MRRRAVVLGLDGVPYSLLTDLMKRGRIPCMASLFEGGYFGRMSVCIPEISSVSWSSFMTGAQSGEHGIYGFTDLEPFSYRLYFPNYTHLKAPTLWDRLGSEERKAVVINMPATYPARKINGALVSGFVAVDIGKAVYPAHMLSKLKESGYRIDLDTARAKKDTDYLFRDLALMLAGRKKVADLLWDEIDWDLFIVVVTGTDRLMHLLWDAFENESHPYHRDFLAYFDEVDSFVGLMFERFSALNGSKDGENTFYMLSDHGFSKIECEVYLNRWLQESGYLNLANDRPLTIMGIGSGSKAFALDPSRIYINLKGKYPLGAVDRDDYEMVRSEIKQGLEALRHENGKPVVKEVFMKEALYAGPHAGRAPDLVALSHRGFDLKGKVAGNSVFGRSDLTGMHSQDDAFFFSSSGVACDSIFEAGKRVLDRL